MTSSAVRSNVFWNPSCTVIPSGWFGKRVLFKDAFPNSKSLARDNLIGKGKFIDYRVNLTNVHVMRIRSLMRNDHLLVIPIHSDENFGDRTVVPSSMNDPNVFSEWSARFATGKVLQRGAGAVSRSGEFCGWEDGWDLIVRQVGRLGVVVVIPRYHHERCGQSQGHDERQEEKHTGCWVSDLWKERKQRTFKVTTKRFGFE